MERSQDKTSARPAKEPVGIDLAKETDEPLCVICKAPAVAPRDEEEYCESHWDERVELKSKAKERFTCRRILRGVDYEHYVVDHEDFGTYCAEFFVLKQSDFYHVTVLLHNEFNWSRPAFELVGDPRSTSLEEIAAELPLNEAIGSWGGGKYDVTVHVSDERGSFGGEW